MQVGFYFLNEPPLAHFRRSFDPYFLILFFGIVNFLENLEELMIPTEHWTLAAGMKIRIHYLYSALKNILEFNLCALVKVFWQRFEIRASASNVAHRLSNCFAGENIFDEYSENIKLVSYLIVLKSELYFLQGGFKEKYEGNLPILLNSFGRVSSIW